MARPVVALALIAAACTSEPATNDTAAVVEAPPSDSAVVNLDSITVVQRAESLAAALDVWNRVEVISRLEDAGLVVRDLDRAVDAPGFRVEGMTLSVGRGELVVFLYPSARERIAVTSALDSATAAPPGTTQTPWASQPRLITSGNLAAVLITSREQLAERVRNVLAARHRTVDG